MLSNVCGPDVFSAFVTLSPSFFTWAKTPAGPFPLYLLKFHKSYWPQWSQKSCLQTHKRCLGAAQWIGKTSSSVRWARCIRTGIKPPLSTPTLAHYVLGCWRAGSCCRMCLQTEDLLSALESKEILHLEDRFESIQGIIALFRRALRYWREGSLWPSCAVYCGGELPSVKVMYFCISSYFSICPSLGSIGGSGDMRTGRRGNKASVKLRHICGEIWSV